ncbi:MAG: hypothetical protein JNJ73_00345 [Hyphomonadaceae bacterium]|nr:hypothetical protein [Hyphomonadaceae bacterium]
MRSLAALTTTAAIALGGVASAQTGAYTPGVTPTSPQIAPQAVAGGATPVQSAVHAYAAFQKDVGDLRGARIGNANELESALDTGARHNRDALGRGWIAYGAMTAAQSPAFVRGVREAAAFYGRDAVVNGMMADTGWARLLKGGDEATGMVLAATVADASRINDVAERYREMAYSLQRQRWANAVAPQQAMRVQRVRDLGRTDASSGAAPNPRLYAAPTTYTPWTDPTAFGGRRFWDALRGGELVTEVSAPAALAWRIKPERAEAINRMTTIAALDALGATAEQPQRVSQLLSEPRSNSCLEMAQLQLYQCMSAARFRYENAFCMSQHALRDVGQCINGVAQLAPSNALAQAIGPTTPARQ